MLGSEIATTTQVLEIHSSILGKNIQEKQLQCYEFVRKMHQRVSDFSTYEPRPFLLPCSLLAKICLIPYFVWDAISEGLQQHLGCVTFIKESCGIIQNLVAGGKGDGKSSP